jgi:xanthine dehydrogenase accessory factor
MTEHTHHHDEDPACAVAHGTVPALQAGSSTAGQRTLVAVFASPVAGYLLRYGADMGFRGLLLEPDEARAAGAAALVAWPVATTVDAAAGIALLTAMVAVALIAEQATVRA